MSINYSAASGGRIHFEIGKKKITPTIFLPKTNSNEIRTLTLRELLPLPKGNSVLKCVVEYGNINLDSVKVR